MHGEIVKRTIAGGKLALPIKEDVGISHEILIHFDADMIDRTDGALAQERPDVLHDRVLDIVIAKDGNLAGALRRFQHPLGIGIGRRHRLFAPDMLAGFEGCNRHLGVELIGSGDGNDVDLWIGDQRPPVCS